jgi:hypothetical protein
VVKIHDTQVEFDLVDGYGERPDISVAAAPGLDPQVERWTLVLDDLGQGTIESPDGSTIA